MIFIKTFKGYEDKVIDLDLSLNNWIAEHKIDVKSIQTALSHEQNSRTRSGDLIYTVMYKADSPIE